MNQEECDLCHGSLRGVGFAVSVSPFALHKSGEREIIVSGGISVSLCPKCAATRTGDIEQAVRNREWNERLNDDTDRKP